MTVHTRFAVPCDTPVDAGLLTDYWLALLPADEEERVETHLFACDECGDRLQEIIRLTEALRPLARAGALRVVVGEALVDEAVAKGRRVRQYDLVPGGSVACTIAADDDLLIARLAADLSGVAQVDVSLCDAQGVERQRLRDIPVRADAGRVVLNESTAWAKAGPSMTMVARLLAVGADGGERLLGEYTFNHTRTIPGPAAWEW